MCPREESNLDREIRSLQFYPLNYEGATSNFYIDIPVINYFFNIIFAF